jgi:ATP-binding cassette subfamily F protein uup
MFGRDQNLSFAEQHELKKLPERISVLEHQIHLLTQQMEDPALYTKDPELFDKIMRAMPKLQADLTAAEERWVLLESLQG